jgi:hypothetical protein
MHNSALIILAALEGGLIYGYHDDQFTRLLAIILLQRLNKFGLVEGFRGTQSHFGKSTLSL